MRFAAAVLLVLCAGLGLASSVAAQGTRLVEPAGGFSYLPPPGWQPQRMEGARYRFCFFPSPGLVSTLGFIDADARLSLVRYIQSIVADARTHSPHLRVLSQGPFSTTSGLHGYRAVIEEVVLDKKAHFVFLGLPLAGSRTLLVFAAWPAAQNAQLAPAIDQSLKTFQLQ